MKSEILRNGLNVLTGVTNSPILLAVKDKVLYLGGYSDTATVVINADVDEVDFHYVLPPEHAKQLVKSLKTGIVTLEPGINDTLIVTYDKSKITFTTMDVTSISYKLLMHHYKEDFSFTIDGELLNKALQTVIGFSVGDNNDIRAKNVHISIENDEVEVAGSNGNILAVYKFPITTNHKKGDLPLSLVGRVISVMGKTFTTNMEVGFNSKKMFYKSTDDIYTYKVTLPMVDSPPFPYKPLIDSLNNSNTSSTVILDKSDLLEQGRSVLYFTDDKFHNRVKLSFTPKDCLIEGDNESGAFSIELEPISSDATGSMYISLDYLTKAASMVNSPEVRLKLVNSKVLIKDDSFSCVIPPLRN